MTRTPEERLQLAKIRLRSILLKHVIATGRTLEQKISDAGPMDQRIDPHVLTKARKELLRDGKLKKVVRGGVPWYHLSDSTNAAITRRLGVLEPIHLETTAPDFTLRLGQTLEIAVLRGLRRQRLTFLGNFPDLDDHDDSQLYSKEDPPTSLSGLSIRGGRKLDFILVDGVHGAMGLEVKNIREWIYPDRGEVKDLIGKCNDIGAVPVLVARRIPYVTFSVLYRCGVIIHQNYNQLYPAAESALAEKAKDKTLLGYHDIRLGNEPDGRMMAFLQRHLPNLLEGARKRYEQHRASMERYGNGGISYGHQISHP